MSKVDKVMNVVFATVLVGGILAMIILTLIQKLT